MYRVCGPYAVNSLVHQTPINLSGKFVRLLHTIEHQIDTFYDELDHVLKILTPF
jgi:hypothetical protein